MPKTTCTECENKFEADPQVKKNEDLHIHYFQCPHCNQFWIAYVTDPAIRRNLRKIRKFRDLASRKNISAADRVKRKTKLSRLIDDNRREMEHKRNEVYTEEIAAAFEEI